MFHSCSRGVETDVLWPYQQISDNKVEITGKEFGEPNILDTTTEKYEKLQIDRIRTMRDGTTITIEATARYKLKDDKEFETDTYCYTEMKIFQSFTLTNLSKGEGTALIETFVLVVPKMGSTASETTPRKLTP